MGYFTGLLWLMRRNAERKIAANYQLSYVANCSHDPIFVQTSVTPSRAPRVAGSCYAAMGVAYTGILVYIWATYFGCSFGKVSAGGFTTRRCVLERLKKKGKLARLPQIYRWWYDCENQQAEGQRHKQFKNLDPNPPKLKKKKGVGVHKCAQRQKNASAKDPPPKRKTSVGRKFQRPTRSPSPLPNQSLRT